MKGNKVLVNTGYVFYSYKMEAKDSICDQNTIFSDRDEHVDEINSCMKWVTDNERCKEDFFYFKENRNCACCLDKKPKR